MVDISSGNKKISITVSSAGNKGNIATSPDMSMFYTERSKEWAISEKIVNNEDYSSKYYANESKKQAQISINKTTEVVNSGNEALSNIDNAKTGALTDIEINKTNAITDIVNQENLSVNNVNTVGATQVNNVNSAGTTQINLAKEQVTLATNQANIATEKANIATTQAGIATDKTIEVVESGNTALSNIATAKSDALNEINTTGAGYVENAKQYAQNALTSANNASASEANALSYKNSALESSQTATEQANIAVANANKAVTSATNAKTSETNARSSEVRCEEILSRLGTAIKIKGRVDSVGDLPLGDNLDGDAYLVGGEGLDSYPEYYWYQDHWEFLGTTGTSLSWGLISGDISNQTDLQTALNNKQDKGNYALKSEIPTNNNQLANGAGYITSSYHDSTKQDVISDLATIRAGAAKGATALQNTAVGSATKPIYINSSGVATAITSYSGNSATATKATQDSSGNQINTSYMPLKYSRYSISTYASSNPYIKLATFTANNTTNYDNSILFWVEILHASNNKAYALCKLSSRWGATAYTGTNFEILEKYGYSGYFSYFDTLTWAYKYTTANSKGSIIGEIWLKTTNINYVSYYFRPAECNEYGDYSMTPVSMTSNPWTYYNESGTSTSIASTAITSGYTQVKVTDKSIRYYEPLLSHKWSDHLLNDTAWLRADTFSWQDGNTYSLAYNELLSEYNNSASVSTTEGSITFKRTPKGYKIALSTQETAIAEKYATDGIAWYYILDTTNKKFKLPRAKHPSLVTLTNSVPVYGNGMTLGITNGTTNYGLAPSSNTENNWAYRDSAYGTTLPRNHGRSGNTPGDGQALGITTDPTKSGIVADLSSNVKDYNMYLYFYVGAFTKSAEAQTAGLKAELFNGKADVDTPSIQAPYLKTTYVNGTSGYNIWSNGYCEQWGGPVDASTITLAKKFKDTNYNIFLTTSSSDNPATFRVNHKNKSINTFTIIKSGNAAACYWKTSGYLAKGEY